MAHKQTHTHRRALVFNVATYLRVADEYIQLQTNGPSECVAKSMCCLACRHVKCEMRHSTVSTETDEWTDVRTMYG